MNIPGRVNVSVKTENGFDTSEKLDILISNNARLIFQWICFAVLCQVIDVFGTITNLINIICFFKQGFRDPVNVSLFGLAVSDLGCLVTLIWLNICFTPVFQEADLPFDAFDILYLTAGWPHVIFTRVTSWITAFITLERCLCITLPLKVKRIVTSKRVSVIIACTFIVLIASVSPVYYVNRYAMKFEHERNKTILRLIHTDDRTSIEQVSLTINNVIIPFGAFITVIVCTATLVITLRRKTKWRMTTSSGNSDSFSNRDQKIAKMVVIISTVFIICFIPSCISFLAMTMEPEIAIDGLYRNVFIVIFGLGFVLESMNSAVNIFIYYRMSSRYRAVLREFFSLNEALEKVRQQNPI